MKRKHLFYSTSKLWEHHQYFTLKGWLRAKGPILDVKRYKSAILVRYGINLQPKHRHARSWLVRKRFALLGYTHNHHFSYTRYSRLIGRTKHGKWLRTPKRGRSDIKGKGAGNEIYRT